MVSGTGLHKRYGALEVLRGASLQVPSGVVAAITGPSGAGKSTLLHIIGTLDTPDSGDLVIDGHRLEGLSGKRMAAFRNRRIGFVFQFHHLLGELSAIENVALPAMIGGLSKRASLEKAGVLLDRMGLKNRIEHRPAQLSGGEQQRVAVARALINDPALVLADEPSGNLDTDNAYQLHQLFFELRDETGKTFIIVTHNEQLAKQADIVFRMQDGKLID